MFRDVADLRMKFKEFNMGKSSWRIGLPLTLAAGCALADGSVAVGYIETSAADTSVQVVLTLP
jgi:hypothetical protein